MSNHPSSFALQPSVGSQQYLDATVRTASPARLRLMVIERGIEVAQTLAEVWRDKQVTGTNEHSLKLLDLLNELLSGVTGGASDSESDVCTRVSDLYVFLIQHLIAAEDRGDALAVEEIRLVLEAEAETWRLVCSHEAGISGRHPAGTPTQVSATKSLNFQA